MGGIRVNLVRVSLVLRHRPTTVTATRMETVMPTAMATVADLGRLGDLLAGGDKIVAV